MDYIKNNLLVIIIAIFIGGLLLVTVLRPPRVVDVKIEHPDPEPEVGRSVQRLIVSYDTASSSKMEAGPGQSVRLLETAEGRTYASFCNDDVFDEAYLFFATTTAHGHTVIVSTSTAAVEIQPKTCYEIDQDNLVRGEVWGMIANATSTLIVVELN